MSQLQFIDLLNKTLWLILELSAPILVTSITVGLSISIFQSVTQIQESTLTFVPKIIAGITTIIALMPWMLGTYIHSVNEMFANMPQYLH